MERKNMAKKSNIYKFDIIERVISEVSCETKEEAVENDNNKKNNNNKHKNRYHKHHKPKQGNKNGKGENRSN